MKIINFVPKTNTGKWASGLIISFFIFFAAFQLIVALGYRGGETFFSNPALAVTAILMGVSGVTAFFTGIYSIVRKKERSIFAFLATIIGLFVLIFILGEILSPH